MDLPLLMYIGSSDAFVLKKNGPPYGAHGTSCVSHGRYLLQKHSLQRCSMIRPTMRLHQKLAGDADDATSKGIVSFLTTLVNSAFDAWSILFSRIPSSSSSSSSSPAADETNKAFEMESIGVLQRQPQPPPSSPVELLDRIRDDYTERNYLWTGDLDVEANFVKSCRFTDPTLSFVGTDKYIKNVQNLRPILKLITNVESECRSELMDIQLYDSYIQTRWKMIGTLSRLPWKPKIDVIGTTKFWYHNNTNQIYFYDEMWEIPANQALLQLVTPTTYKS